MSDITEFLLARLDEDETYAIQAQTHEAWAYDGYGEFGPYVKGAGVETEDSSSGIDIALYLVHMNPWRALAEVKAKRRIVERINQRRLRSNVTTAMLETLLDLASAYSDHPNYEEEWSLSSASSTSAESSR